jgi:recombinational DNA repair ATPase RecF
MALKSLTLSNFTAFSEAEFNFAPQLNVIVGENGAGKTHVLNNTFAKNRSRS